MELDPLYCDVIIVRWEQFTGKTAQREGPLRRAAVTAIGSLEEASRGL